MTHATRLDCDRPGCRTNTDRVCDSYCRSCMKVHEEYRAAVGLAEPFCACGRRSSDCDGSRRACPPR